MPRQASRGSRSRLSRPQRPLLKKRQTLDALSIAEQQTLENPKIRRSRLGTLDDRPVVAHFHEDSERAGKRRRIEVSDEDNEVEEGSDSEGNAWQLGGVGSDADSDLDSDEAMNESDEERFADFIFRGSRSRESRQSHLRRNVRSEEATSHDILDSRYALTDLSERTPTLAGHNTLKGNEDAHDDEDSLGEDAVDLATALDMNETEELLEKKSQKSASRKRPGSQVSDDSRGSQTSLDFEEGSDIGDKTDGSNESEEHNSDSSDDDNESTISFSDNGTDDTGNHVKLQSFVESLKKDESSNTRQAKSAVKHVSDEPSPFGVRPSQKLTVADILPTITNARLRQSLKVLHSSEYDEGSTHRSGIPGKLAPPLAKRQQDRLDRAAAYEKSKETLNRWIDTVKHNRRAEHLSFPLPDSNTTALLGTKQLLPISVSEPITLLENSIQNIMEESGFGPANGKSEEDRIQAVEELQERKLPLEEVRARRAELRKQRDLLFREEKRARRIKKIKSKAYRRVHRKARDKEAQLERQALAEAGLLNSEDERERDDRRRAEERMGARHGESKWAKAAKASGKTIWDEEAKSGMTDMAHRDEELRRRVQGRSAGESDTDSIASSFLSDQHDSDPDLDQEEIGKMKREVDIIDGADASAQPTSGLASMKFMQRAETARKATNDADLEQLRRRLTENTDRTMSDADDALPMGRQRFGSRNDHAQSTTVQPGKVSEFDCTISDSDFEGLSDREGRNGADVITDPVPAHPKGNSKPKDNAKRLHPNDVVLQQEDTFYSPWLTDTPKNRKSKNDDTLQINLTDHMKDRPRKPSLPQPIKSAKSKSKRTPVTTSSHIKVLTSGSESESDDDNDAAKAHEYPLTQEELVRAGFAGDDVENDFAKEKEDLVQEEGDQVIDNTLPGWGSWTGEGISKREQKRGKGRFVTTIKGVDPQRRKDAKLDRVIINEKKVKKNGKYLASELPHVFENRQQYERSLRIPLGPEWTTKNTFQDATKPRVLMKQGIIRPMERPMV